ncbi:MAG: 2-hydroxyacyl-CoA dehydratase [Deltaproteobacteria bacterium]|nr:2-hydroxyacyl-CoA dehydratase [Deltaproteobacteria bacterium]
MKARPAPMTIFDAFVHLAPIVSLRGLPVARQYYEILLAELQDRVQKGIGAITNEQKRLMWDNIAVWFKLRDWSHLFAERGCSFVAATYTNAWAETIHYLDESSPFESMAKAYNLVILNNNLKHRLNLFRRAIRHEATAGRRAGRKGSGYRSGHDRFPGVFRGTGQNPAGGLFRSTGS